MSEKFDVLHALSDEQVIALHDKHATRTIVGTQHYVDELNRRFQVRETTAMRSVANESHKLAKRTYALTIATVCISIFAFVVATLALLNDL